MLSKALGALAVAFSIALPASATTFNFAGGGGNAPSYTFGPTDGLTVTATAGYAFGGDIYDYGQVYQGGYGLGVDLGIADGPYVDGTLANNALVFEFNQSVNLESLSLSLFNTEGSWFLWWYIPETNDEFDIYNGNGGWSLVSSENTDNPYGFGGGLTTNKFAITATDHNDDFKVYSLTVSGAIPEPATWLMMIMGFGLVGIASRRRTGLVRA
ncbi:PEPxxWA-CTERM sorting domain-containing protein [Pseudokordiimonas caeni]|uniref:PEPxxWA-CTERM sorting domain-containing protein n=1 Tax=Pseudokordiimonas caeni TaxID=2997908 RepID=UPI0028114C07|nr:PEPxxWA-CTERM sorting domain-containing protein [Pseudokordiimonas caeni]